MKHKIYLLVAMLTMALALTSCFKDEEENRYQELYQKWLEKEGASIPKGKVEDID